MTVQVKDVILINGVSCCVISDNISLPGNDVINLNDIEYVYCSALAKRYHAKWEIKNGHLYLNWVSGASFEDNLVNSPIPANWFSGSINVSQGKVIDERNMGYFITYEGEFLISIENGAVISSNLKNNTTGIIEDVNVSIDRKKIKEYIESRKVTSLLHFTNVKNIPSIMTNGLLGMEELSSKNITVLSNDLYRYDAINNAICTSISFVNYKMFYKLRCDNPNEDWAVIKISPSVLWEKPCVFCSDNAANARVSSIPSAIRMDLPYLESMFCDEFDFIKRSDLKIPDFYTTNPQAEVMVLNGIEVDYIESINIDEASKVNNLDQFIEDNKPFRRLKPYYHNPSLFTYRTDFRFWQCN